jgi:hypothetical protein
VAGCWEKRGCDAEMMATCPHAVSPEEKCPTKCAFARCYSSRHVDTSDPALVFCVEADRSVAAKEECVFCGYFLVSGPKV